MDRALRREAEWCELYVSGAKVVKSSFDTLWNHAEEEWRARGREAIIKKEFETLAVEKKCWEKIGVKDPRVNKKPMKGRWVFAIKYDKAGKFLKCKARYCICGHAQEYFGKSCSPTIRSMSVRLMSAIAAPSTP